jgi:hypothetical protein
VPKNQWISIDIFLNYFSHDTHQTPAGYSSRGKKLKNNTWHFKNETLARASVSCFEMLHRILLVL